MSEELNERITIKRVNVPHQVLALLIPIEVLGIGVFLVYAFSHWTSFVAQSSALFSWLAWFIGLALYTCLAFLMVKVIRSGIEAALVLAHGIADIYGKFTEHRIARARRELLHTDTNYVVFLEKGKVIVQPVLQERASYSIRQDDEHQDEQEEIESLPAPVQSFYDLLAAGVIQAALSQGKMLLGYIGGQLRYGSWLDLYSCGIGGVSGSGKTTTVRFLLFQAILAGARLLMIDPHIGEPEESLAAQFRSFPNVHVAVPCDDTPAAVLKRIRWFDSERKRRKVTGQKTPAIIFVVDEFNALMRVEEVKKEMASLLLSISQEGRKFGLFAMLIGQRWSDQDMGGANMGAAIRSSLASTLAHRFTDETQAKKLVGGRHGAECLELPQGHYLFRDTNGTIAEMITPYTTIEDGAVIQSLLATRQGAENSTENTLENSMKTGRKQVERIAFSSERQDARNLLENGLKTGRNESDTEQLDTAPVPEQEQELHKKMQLVVRLHAEGKQKPDIVRAVWGVSPGGSAAYESANTEYQAIMRRVYEQLGA
jgi:hypothetical protein